MRLTVGITYHNEGELLTRCLNSFWQQAAKPFEMILFDDASSLRPEDFIPPEIPVKIIRSETNQGPGKGRNQILKEAQGDWIHFHDADDWVMPNWMEKVKERAQDSDLILTELKSFRGEEELASKVIGLKQIGEIEELLRFAIQHFILPAAGTFKTEFARAIHGYRESLWQSEDWDFYIRLIQQNPRYQILTEPLCGIQVRSESRSQKQIETLSCVLQAILFLQKELPEKFKQDLADKAAWAGSRLFTLGERNLAREAFNLAQTLGPATFSDRKRFYRFIAQHYGQEVAEKTASLYHLLKHVFQARSLSR